MPFTRRNILRLSTSGIAAGALSALGCSRSAPDSAGRVAGAAWEEGIADLEMRVRRSMDTHQVPGVSIAVIRGGRIAWTGFFGVRDSTTGVPVDDSTVFSAQSMSKPVFAYRVMKLCEQGTLDLDAPLTRYTRDTFVRDDDRLSEITARRVLSHTTGLPNWRSGSDPLRIDFAPGSKWSYSGEGYYYLQSIVSQLTGNIDETRCETFEADYRVCASDFAVYMETNLLRPFGMMSSGYSLTTEIQRAVASAHDASGRSLPQPPTISAAAIARYGSSGALMTTATDYARFLIEIMQPKPPDSYRLNEASRREMLMPQIEAMTSPFKTSWALGWSVWHLQEGDVLAHGGDLHGWHSQSVFSPERRTGFVILTNGEGGSALIWTDLLETLLERVVFA